MGTGAEFVGPLLAEELAAGHVTFDLVFMGPTPAERITFKSYLDINLLTQIV